MPALAALARAARSTTVLSIALLSFAVPLDAQCDAQSDLRIEHPYARATPPGARSGGAYLTIENRGGTADRLIHVATPVAGEAEVHSMSMEGNVMRMRAISAVDVPPHATTTLKPGGYHIMLLDLTRPLVPGEAIPLTLTFERAGTIDVTARVESSR